MNSTKADAEGGINEFIRQQKKLPDKANITLIQFDTEVDIVYSGDLQECPNYTLTPRGGTALLDALGEYITKTGERLSAMKEEDRPKMVTCVIVTDGGENSSKEYTLAKVKEMIKHQENKYSWDFIYLGSDVSGMKDAYNLGFAVSRASQYNPNNTRESYKKMSEKFSQCRSAVTSGEYVLAKNALDYSEQDKAELIS